MRGPRFIISLMVRNPETLANLKEQLGNMVAEDPNLQEQYERTVRRPGDPESYVDAFGQLDPTTRTRAVLDLLRIVMNNPRIGGLINTMNGASSICPLH